MSPTTLTWIETSGRAATAGWRCRNVLRQRAR